MKNYIEEHNNYINKMIADFPMNDFQPKRRKNRTVNQVIKILEYVVATLIISVFLIGVAGIEDIVEFLFF